MRNAIYRFFVGKFFDPIAEKLGYMHVADVSWTLDEVYCEFDDSAYYNVRGATDDLIREAIQRINPNC